MAPVVILVLKTSDKAYSMIGHERKSKYGIVTMTNRGRPWSVTQIHVYQTGLKQSHDDDCKIFEVMTFNFTTRKHRFRSCPASSNLSSKTSGYKTQALSNTDGKPNPWNIVLSCVWFPSKL